MKIFEAENFPNYGIYFSFTETHAPTENKTKVTAKTKYSYVVPKRT